MSTSPKSFAETLREEHTSLLGDLQELDEGVRSASGEGPAELASRLEEARTHLLAHFRFEEEGGYMAPVLKEEPRLTAEAEALLTQHGQLAQALDALIQDVRAARSVEEVHRERIRGWLKQVRQHEAGENSLVQEAYYSAGATGD
jgi:hypothetical protein